MNDVAKDNRPDVEVRLEIKTGGDVGAVPSIVGEAVCRYGCGSLHTPDVRELVNWANEHEFSESHLLAKQERLGGLEAKDAFTANEPLKLHTPCLDLDEAHERAVANGGEVKGYRELGLNRCTDLGQAIRVAGGAFSTCWTNMFEAGVFKSEEALDIATQLEHEITHRFRLVIESVNDLIEASMTEGRPLTAEEVERWSASMHTGDVKNTMAEWLFWRFGRQLPPEVKPYAEKWADLEQVDKDWWAHEANAVERAVLRGGFKQTEPGNV